MFTQHVNKSTFNNGQCYYLWTACLMYSLGRVPSERGNKLLPSFGFRLEGIHYD